MIKLVFFDIDKGFRAIMAAFLAQKQAAQLNMNHIVDVMAVTSKGYDVDRDLADLAFIGIDPSSVKYYGCDKVSYFGIDVAVNLDSGVAGVCKSLPGKEIVIDWGLPVNNSGDELYFEVIEKELTRNIRNLFTGGYLATMAGLKHELEAILDHLPSGVIVHDLSRKINWFNSAAERILGYKRSEVIGRDCHTVFSNGFCGGKCEFCHDSGKSEKNRELKPMNYVINTTTKDGVPRVVEMFLSPVSDLNNNPIGVIACFNDITEVLQLRSDLKKTFSFHGIIGADESMQEVYSLIQDLADSDCAVLVQGESGTGKELVAGAIHGESTRSGSPFIAVNCGALPEGILESELFGHVKGAFTGAFRDKKGKFELADGGTIFLDEIGELSPLMQVKLLRVLQEQVLERVGGEESVKINVRVISATNRDLRKMIRKGTFREDLFYRLCVVPLELPPLRMRRNDIPLLIRHFIKLSNTRQDKNILGVDDKALQVMIDYQWPGNIRELQNAIHYAFVKCKKDMIGIDHLPPEISQFVAKPVSFQSTVVSGGRVIKRRKRKLDYQTVVEALEKAGNNRSRAAESLGVGRATLYRFMQEIGLV